MTKSTLEKVSGRKGENAARGNRLVEKEHGRAPRGARLIAGLSGLVLALTLTVTLSATSSAAPGETPKPTISGNAVVGHTLTSSSVGADANYKWQRCNPAVATCDPAAPHGDADWPDIAGADEITYLIQPSDIGFFIRVRAHDVSLGTHAWTPSDPVGPVTAGNGAPPPPLNLAPEHGVNVLAEPVAGSVEVRTPGGTFKPLTEASELPVGTIFDTRGSRVKLTAATGLLGEQSADQPIDFYLGVFKIIQPPGLNAPATAKLVEKLTCGKGQGKAASASGAGPVATAAGKRRRKLWGSGSGGYRTAGSGSTGSVVGTTWLTLDTCAHTLTKVIDGHGVLVFDKKTKKKKLVGPGEKYFAKLG
jgi:hypothetical protein